MKVRLFVVAGACLLFGMLFFAWFHQWVIISRPYTVAQLPVQEVQFVRAKKSLFFWSSGKMARESIALLWTNNVVDNCTHLIRAWLTLLDEEELLETKVSLQTVSFIPNTRTLIVSLDQLPFAHNATTYTKLMTIEGLLKTIAHVDDAPHEVLFLVHHKQPDDYNLDFSRPWPLSGFLDSSKDSSGKRPTCTSSRRFTVMLDPAGDAQHTGRIIGDCFERGLTLQFAQAVKEYLEREQPSIRVVLTRFPGESLEPLQNASFANRLHADLYVSLSFFQETEPLARAYMYYLLYSPVTDFWAKSQKTVSLAPYNCIYKKNLGSTVWYANKAHESLCSYTGLPALEVQPILGIPCKPLIGVCSPAFGLEIGLCKKQDWFNFVSPVAQSINKLYQAVCIQE